MKTIHVTGALALFVVGPLALATSMHRPTSGRAAEPMPMLFFWHGRVAEGQSKGEIYGLLDRTKAYARTHYPESPVRIQLLSLGSSDALWWFREHDSVAARKQVEREVSGDKGWVALEDEWTVRFDQGSAMIYYLFPIGGAVRDDGSKPFRWLRVTHSPAIQLAPARQLARNVVEYLEANYPGVDARAYSADIDDPTAIYWMVDYESVSTWESIRRRMLEDEEYTRLFEGADDLFHDDAAIEFLKDF